MWINVQKSKYRGVEYIHGCHTKHPAPFNLNSIQGCLYSWETVWWLRGKAVPFGAKATLMHCLRHRISLGNATSYHSTPHPDLLSLASHDEAAYDHLRQKHYSPSSSAPPLLPAYPIPSPASGPPPPAFVPCTHIKSSAPNSPVTRTQRLLQSPQASPCLALTRFAILTSQPQNHTTPSTLPPPQMRMPS